MEVHVKGILARIGVALSVGALVVPVLGASSAAATVTAPAATAPVLIVANPTDGDSLPRGKAYFIGSAFDPSATTGNGIAEVTVYSGDRDDGGTWLGTAAMPKFAANLPLGVVTGKFSASLDGTMWRIKTARTLTRRQSGTLFFYALSALTGTETVVKVQDVDIDPGRSITAKP